MMSFLLLLSVFGGACSIDSGKKQEPMVVLVDTDMGNGVDDVMALQMLLDYEREGKVQLSGITVSKCHPLSVEYVDAYCRLNGREDIPLGYAYNGVNTEEGRFLRPTLDTLIADRPVLQPRRILDSDIPEGYKLMRELLAGQKDGSVLLVALGPLTNLARLLVSSADEYSPLDGMQLVRKKVNRLALMGGNYTDFAQRPEWNVAQDVEAARIVFEQWPTPVIASGSEVGAQFICTKEQIRQAFPQGEHHPLYISFCLAGSASHYHGETWDATLVHHLMEPEDTTLTLSVPGRISVDSVGFTRFVPQQDGNHRYLKAASANTHSLYRCNVQTMQPNRQVDTAATCGRCSVKYAVLFFSNAKLFMYISGIKLLSPHIEYFGEITQF